MQAMHAEDHIMQSQLLIEFLRPEDHQRAKKIYLQM
jgi:hypothetical protein